MYRAETDFDFSHSNLHLYGKETRVSIPIYPQNFPVRQRSGTYGPEDQKKNFRQISFLILELLPVESPDITNISHCRQKYPKKNTQKKIPTNIQWLHQKTFDFFSWKSTGRFVKLWLSQEALV